MAAASSSGSTPLSPDPRFPGLRPEVVAGYLQAPETMVAEVMDGELFVMPRPRRQHAHAATRFLRRLGPFHDPIGDDPGGWVVLVEPELHLGAKPDIVVPNLAGWCRERVPADFLSDDVPAHVDLPPDWVCEVISEHTQAQDRGKKRRIYRRERVGHDWLADPRDRTVEVYRLDNGRWVEVDTYEGDTAVRAEPFESVELDLAALWKI